MKLEIMGGTHISEAGRLMCVAAQDSHEIVTADFNGITLTADIRTKPEDIEKQFDDAMEKDRVEYEASPQYLIDLKNEKIREKARFYERKYLFRTLKSVIDNDEKLLDWLCAAEENGSLDWKRIRKHLQAKGFVCGYGVPNLVNLECREDVFKYIVGQCMYGISVPQIIHHFVERWKAKFILGIKS